MSQGFLCCIGRYNIYIAWWTNNTEEKGNEEVIAKASRQKLGCQNRQVQEALAVTPVESQEASAPLIHECHANFECRLYDDALEDKYNFFVFEVVKVHVAASTKYLKTIDYIGDGMFMVWGKIISRKSLFEPAML